MSECHWCSDKQTHCTYCGGYYFKKCENLEKKLAEKDELLKLKTQNEVNASVNADCLDGCRIQLAEKDKLIEQLKEEFKKPHEDQIMRLKYEIAFEFKKELDRKDKEIAELKKNHEKFYIRHENIVKKAVRVEEQNQKLTEALVGMKKYMSNKQSFDCVLFNKINKALTELKKN